MDAAYATINDAARDIDVEEPWKSKNAAQLDARSLADWLSDLNVSTTAKRAIRAEQEANQGVSLERQSFLAFLTMVKGGGLEKYWTDSETGRCAQGNQALATALAATLGKKIQLGVPVTSIVVGNQEVMVTTGTGHRFVAEDVILTVPPSTWSQIRFTPELPEDFKPQMGTAVKFLSAVKRRYWNDAKLLPDSLTDTDIAMTWEGTCNQPGDIGAELTAFSGGPSADNLRSRPPVERDAYCTSQLEKLYPGYGANVTTTRFMNWPSDPNTLAGYSFLAPKQVLALGPTLHDGLGQLHFAGEYASLKFPGYMEARLNSAVTLARRIAQRDGIA